MLELLLASGVAVIGMYASLMLTVSSVQGTTEATETAKAMMLAEHILETVRVDAVLWQDAQPDVLQMRYLNQMPWPNTPGSTTGWLPQPANPFAISPQAGQMGGDDITYDNGVLVELRKHVGTRYCVHWRGTWVDTQSVRIDVRVSWPKQHTDRTTHETCPAGMWLDVGLVGSVSLPATVMRNGNAT